MAICALCNNFEFKSIRQYRINFDCSLEQLSKSAATCRTCSLIHQGVSSMKCHWPSETIRRIEVFGRTVEDGIDPSGLFADIYPPNEGSRIRLEYFQSPGTMKPLATGGSPGLFLTETPCDIKDCRTSNIVPECTSDGITLDWAKKQVEMCLKRHSCTRDMNENCVPPLPTRVLELGTTFEHVKLFVQDSGTLRLGDLKRAHYACLSHCWGENRDIVLTKAHLQDMQNGIDWHELPKTFQDAIIFTRALGINYLWIDSLCIVQDDLEDWRHEAAKMADIYESCYFTLAATHSHSDSGGCFAPSLSLNKTVPIYIPNGDGIEPTTIYSRISIPHFEEKPLQEHFDGWPLLTRGWAFQERLLSARLFHFSGRELIFECLQETKCQCGFIDPSNAFKRQLTDGKWKSSAPLSNSKWIEAWWKLVENYSSLDLTVQSDRLQAFAGLAQRIERELKESGETSYMAGIWSQRQSHYKTLRGLFWYVALLDPYGPKGKQFESSAPSWSWGAINSRVSFIKDIEVLEDMGGFKGLQCTPVHDDAPFGDVVNGKLILSGNIFAGKLRFERSTNGDVDLSRYAIQLDFNNREGDEGTAIFPFFADYRLGEIPNDGFPEWLEDDTIYCLFLWSNVGFRLVQHQTGRMVAIVAKQLNSADHIYRRVGLVDLHLSDKSSDVHSEILLRCAVSGVNDVTVI